MIAAHQGTDLGMRVRELADLLRSIPEHERDRMRTRMERGFVSPDWSPESRVQAGLTIVGLAALEAGRSPERAMTRVHLRMGTPGAVGLAESMRAIRARLRPGRRRR